MVRGHRRLLGAPLLLPALPQTPGALCDAQAHKHRLQHRPQHILHPLVPVAGQDRSGECRLVLRPRLRHRLYLPGQLPGVADNGVDAHTRHDGLPLEVQPHPLGRHHALLAAAARARHCRHHEPDHRQAALPAPGQRPGRGHVRARYLWCQLQDCRIAPGLPPGIPLCLRAIYICPKKGQG